LTHFQISVFQGVAKSGRVIPVTSGVSASKETVFPASLMKHASRFIRNTSQYSSIRKVSTPFSCL